MVSKLRALLLVLLAAATWVAAGMATIRLGTPPSGPAGKAAQRRGERPTGYVIKVAAPPTLDGKLDDVAWEKLPPLKLARTLDGSGAAAQPTEVKLCHDGSRLYVAVEATEPSLDRLRAPRQPHDGAIWGDDSIEIFLGFGGQYWHFGINAAASTYDGRAKDSSWNAGPDFKAAAGRGKGEWTLEVAIPLAKLVGSGKLPTEWMASFNRNRYAAGTWQESAWSPTFSGDSHVPERFGRLLFTDPPKEEPKEAIRKDGVEFLPAAQGEGVVRFDLAALPQGAKVCRADLWLHRTTQVDGASDEALDEIEVYPLLADFAAGGAPSATGKRLAIRGPWLDCLDATEAVQQWASGKPNGGFFVKVCPFLNAAAACLDIAYEGKPGNVPPQVSEAKAFHRSGQTFLTWREIGDPVGRDEIAWGELKLILDDLDRRGQLRYCIYRSATPITAETLHQAERIALVRPCSAWNLNGRNVERGIDHVIATRYALMHGQWNPWSPATMDGPFGRECPMERLVIQDGAPPLERTTGLYVHTTDTPAKAYYAVVTMADGVQNTLDISAKNTAGPVEETKAEPEPVLQKEFPRQPYFNYPEKRLHYVRWVASPYCNLPSQYYNWSIGVPDALGPAKGPPKGGTTSRAPLELQLALDGRSYQRTQFRIEPDSIVVTPHDFPLNTWWYGYHESLGTLKGFRQGTVQPYTERRILWFVDWVCRKWPVDRNRILVAGWNRSAGGPGPSGWGGASTGALHLAFRYPEVFNLCIPGHGANPDYSANPHPTQLAIWGKPQWACRTDRGKSVWDELNLVKRLEATPLSADLPPVTFTGSRASKQVTDFMALLVERGYLAMANFNQWSGPKFIPLSANGTWPPPMIRADVRKNLLLPAFSRSKGPGLRGAAYTFLNLPFRWRTDDIVDTPARAEITLFREGRSERGDETADVTLRRCQQLKLAPGRAFAWVNQQDANAVQRGEATVGDDGLLTIPGVRITEKGSRLIVTAK